MQILSHEIKKRPAPPPATTTPPAKKQQQQQHQQQVANAPTNIGIGKSFADVAGAAAPLPEKGFTKVTKKKKAAQPFFQPEYTRLNRQLIFETEGNIPEFISNDNILEVVNSRTEPQGPNSLPHFATRATTYSSKPTSRPPQTNDPN